MIVYRVVKVVAVNCGYLPMQTAVYKYSLLPSSTMTLAEGIDSNHFQFRTKPTTNHSRS